MNDDRWRLAEIVELIDLALADLEMVDAAAFVRDRRLVDATAHRVMHIGEHTKQLSSDLRSRHDHLPWSNMAGMRNVIAHEYGRTDPRLVWRTVHEHFDGLRQICMIELQRLDDQGD